jgi:hypothetical protein
MEEKAITAKGKCDGGAYRALCGWVHEHGGKVRLGRAGEAFMLVVDAPDGSGPSRTAGYTFLDLDELDFHARLISDWLGKISAAARRHTSEPAASSALSTGKNRVSRRRAILADDSTKKECS